MTDKEAIIRTAEQPNSRTFHDSPKLRVLYVTNGDGCGGGAAFSVCALMLDLKARYGIEPVFLTKRESEFSELCRRNGIEVIVQKYYSWSSGNKTFISMLKGKIKNIINKLYFYPKIIRLLNDKHFDIVHTNSSITDMGDIISQYFSLPHVWHLREYGYYYYYSEQYIRTRHARATVNVTISQSAYDYYVKLRKLCRPENTRIIYNGLRIYSPYVKRPADPENINFCMTSNLSPNKNQLMAVQACEKLKTLTHRFTLHLIGDDIHEYAGQIKSFVQSHGLNDCVKIWGARSDIAEILRDMDVGLTLSEREAFGRVTVEYMLNYMPVIGTNTGGTPEIVLDGQTGCLCPLNDSDKLADLMHNFITHPQLLRTMGEKGRERAVTHFSVERNTDEIYSLYQEILGR